MYVFTACGRRYPMGSVAMTPSGVTTNIDWWPPKRKMYTLSVTFRVSNGGAWAAAGTGTTRPARMTV